MTPTEVPNRYHLWHLVWWLIYIYIWALLTTSVYILLVHVFHWVYLDHTMLWWLWCGFMYPRYANDYGLGSIGLCILWLWLSPIGHYIWWGWVCGEVLYFSWSFLWMMSHPIANLKFFFVVIFEPVIFDYWSMFFI